jgi:hypothetical protein
LANISATNTGTSHHKKRRRTIATNNDVDASLPNVLPKTGPPHNKRRISTIATIKAVDARLQKCRQQHVPIAQQAKQNNNRNEQG